MEPTPPIEPINPLAPPVPPTPPPTPEPPVPAPTPPTDSFSKGGLLNDKQLEIATVVVLSLMVATFTYQIYYYRKKIMQYNRLNDLEDRIEKLEQKV